MTAERLAEIRERLANRPNHFCYDLLAAYDERGQEIDSIKKIAEGLAQDVHDLRGELHNCGMRCARLEDQLKQGVKG